MSRSENGGRGMKYEKPRKAYYVSGMPSPVFTKYTSSKN